MLGWRGRVGLILPADNAVIEPELYGLGLPGITYHASRLPAAPHEVMRKEAAPAALTLRETGVDVAVYCCAETSFDAGAPDRDILTDVLAQIIGVPVVTATGAMLAAVRRMQLNKIALVTPYTQASGELFEQTLRDEGLAVTACVHRDFRNGDTSMPEWHATNRQSPSTTYGLIRSVDTSDAEGVVVCATNLPILSLVDQAERDLGKPVIACNQSIIWWCLSTLGIKDIVEDAGSLLRASR